MYHVAMATRATALPPAERRAAIIAAALPLLLQCGAHVSTRQIADAAGIAEGTIFGVFPDKEALVQAVLQAALDPEATERELAAIDGSRSFEDQLADAVLIMQRRVNNIWRLLSSTGNGGSGNKGAPQTPPADFAGLVAIFNAHEEQLRTDAVSAARQLRALTLAVSSPTFFAGEPMTAREIVALFLNGISWLAEQDRLIDITPRSYELPRVQMTNGQMRATFVLSTLVLPAAALALSMFAWWRRRR